MEKILLKASFNFGGNIDVLKEKLDKKIGESDGEVLFVNSEASALWIIRGCIDYFDKLDSNFLGKGNSSGIPSMETDYFANAFVKRNIAHNPIEKWPTINSLILNF